VSTIADLVIKLTADSSPAEKDMKSFTGKVQKSFGKALLPAVGVLGGLAVAGKKATDSATALGESQNAVNVVFGDSAKTISDFAKVADKQAGLSMRQLNELVTPIGASLINMGDSADVAADKSVALAKRAADMASVFNVDVSEALGAIQAGLRGEADPLERFGVGLSDAATKAQAMSMGLAKTEAALTAQDKAQARYALLMEQTNKLQGDFVNTSDSAANAARVNAASQENLTASIGTGLLPVVQMYQKALGKTTAFLAEHQGGVKIAAIVLGVLAGAVLAVNGAFMLYSVGVKAVTLATKVYTAAQWLLNAAVAANPFVAIGIAVVALGVALVVAYKKSETFREVVNGVFAAVKTVVLTAVGFILGALDKYLGGIEMVLRAASKLPVVGDKFKGLADSVAGARERVQGLQSSIDNLKSKEVKVTTVFASIYTREERLPGNVIGARAAGGPVKSGMPYLVGEKGPEIFTPHASGRIIPNHAVASGGIAANVSRARDDDAGDVILELDGEVLARFNRRELTRKGRRNVGLEFA
jgi:hypothetical protein